ncbi:DUF397 domain-containing protein [Streptomyces sp. NPDC007984]|uniref:DUF397 domain-containing protein n=1 Tax=Streptomyces sp. NPDC007984 TaxID=3364801 RepID=UPI0036DFE04C
MTRKAELVWFKSSYSSGTNGESCVEIAIGAENATVHVRDSKHTEGPRLALAPEAWSEFLASF